MTERSIADEELLTRLIQGDHAAFATIYRRYWKELIDEAYQRLQKKEDAEEVVQDVFVSLYLRRASLDPQSTLRSYLKTAVKYRVYNIYRSRQVRQQHAADSAGRPPASKVERPDDILAYRELRHRVEEVATLMPEKCRKVFLLSRFDQLSQQEIADRLQISVSTVKKHMTKALALLRAHFPDQETSTIMVFFFVYLFDS